MYRELKEAEHIFNVTLKNNRSVETFKSFLKAINAFYDKLISEYLEKLYKEGKIEEVPRVPLKRLKLFVENLPSEDLKPFIDEYALLRKCVLSKTGVVNEHRRNIEVVFQVSDQEVKLSLKDLKEILERAREFYILLKKYLENV